MALLVTSLGWFSAHSWRTASTPISEPVFLLFLVSALFAGGDAKDRIEAECPSETLRVLDIQPGRVLVALNWDEACKERLLGGSTGELPTD